MDGLPGFDPTQPHTDEEYDAALRAASAQEAAKEQGTSFLERIGQGQQQVTQGQSAAADSPIGTFIRHIPQNVGVGVLDGALTAADKLNSVEEWWGTPTEEQKQALADPSLHAPALPEHPPVPVFSAQALDALRTWRMNIAPEGDNISDALTQGLAQFAIPFAGFAKVFGLSARVGVISNLARGTAADIAATVTAIPSHTQRGSTELLELGRQAENKFGEVLRTVAPDDGLITRYINWMNDTTNEGTLEGEFKNSLDTLSLGLATSGLMKTAATTFKLSLHLPEYVGQNLGPGPVGRSAQKGMVNFHGTRHELPPVPGNDLGAFDLSKVGTGEGAQTRGHGIYLAEAKPVAQGYMRAGMSVPVLVDGKPIGEVARSPAEKFVAQNMAMYMRAGSGVAHAQAMTERLLRNTSPWARMGGSTAELDKGVAFLKRATEAPAGNLYHVDIPDAQVAKMLDWDKPLVDQGQSFIDAFRKAGLLVNGETTGEDAYRKLTQLYATGTTSRGAAEAKASEYLREQGIPGLRFFDNQSRGAGRGTRNMVLFDPKIAKIIKREGK